MKQFSTLIIKYFFLLISEGLCDSKDWSNDAQNSAFHHRNNLLKKKTVILNCNISKCDTFYCIFGQINAVLVSI